MEIRRIDTVTRFEVALSTEDIQRLRDEWTTVVSDLSEVLGDKPAYATKLTDLVKYFIQP